MESISNSIDILRDNINDHYKRLDSEAIWFFLATLGCWSVSVYWIQLLAMVIVFYFLFTQVFREHEYNRSFGQRVDALRSKIENSGFEETEKDRLVGKLSRMSDEYLPIKKTVSKNQRFFVSSLFFAVSAMHFWFTWASV